MGTEEASGPEPSADPSRRDPRLAIAVGGAVALAAIVAVVALSGGSSGDEAAAAPPERCMEGWNADPEARAFGQHNYGSHGYERVQVTRLTEQADELPAGEEGVCAVVFGALQLDTEPFAAGQLLIEGVWRPIALQPEVDLNRVAELQTIAEGQPNASLTGEGVLVEYGEG